MEEQAALQARVRFGQLLPPQAPDLPVSMPPLQPERPAFVTTPSYASKRHLQPALLSDNYGLQKYTQLSRVLRECLETCVDSCTGGGHLDAGIQSLFDSHFRLVAEHGSAGQKALARFRSRSSLPRRPDIAKLLQVSYGRQQSSQLCSVVRIGVQALVNRGAGG